MKFQKRGRTAILLSGRGSNFKAIYKKSIKDRSWFDIVLVISNRKNAGGLQLARRYGIKSVFISPRDFKNSDEYEKSMISLLNEERVDLVCLAGFMKILSPLFINEFKNRIMNIHPSLLPAFPGLNAQKQALEYGVKVSGCTVHFVDTGIDSGPVILQKAVLTDKNDDEESLSEKILKYEHEIYPEAVSLWFEGRLKISGRKVIISK